MGVYIWKERLPSTYQEVEYIGSSGTQYIKLGYIPTVNTSIVTDISWSDDQVRNWAVFRGVTSNDNSSDGVLGRLYSSTYTNFNPRFCNSSYTEAQITCSLDTFHNIVLASNTLEVDGTSYTITTSGTPYQDGMDLFAGNNGGTHGWRTGVCKFKTFKIYENGVIAMDLVPCYRKNDTKIGMYDIVNGVFYTNSGGGTFTKGQDVNYMEHELKNAYIGEYHEYEYTYDFTTGSTSDLQSKGWTVPAGNVVDSNGYYNSSRNWNAMILVNNDLAIACQNADRLVFSLTWSATSNHQRTVSLRSGSVENTLFYGDGIAHTGGNQAIFGEEPIFTESIAYGNNGTYTSTMTVDINNKTWQIEMTDRSTLSGTVTDTAIAAFRNCDRISVYGELSAYIRSFSITIEY